MLKSLSVHNFVVVQDTEMSFSPSLTAMVGETGAGKSVLVGALAAVSGLRAVPSSSLRDPSKKAVIEATFQLDPEVLQQRAELASFSEGEGLITISLTITPSGTVTRRICGEQVSLNVLRRVTENLIDIHSQRDGQTILTLQGQMGALDTFGGSEHGELIDSYREKLSELRRAEKNIQDMKAAARNEDLDVLRFRIEEIEKLHLKEGEIEETESRLEELNNLEKLRDARSKFEETIPFFERVAETLRSDLSAFGAIGGQIAEMAEEALVHLTDLENSVNSLVLDSPDEDVDLVDRLNARLFEVDKVRRKYGPSTQQILDQLSRFKEREDLLNSYEARLSELEQIRDQCLDRAREAAGKVSISRQKLAKTLSEAVCSLMEALSLRKNGFKVEVNQEDSLSDTGIDRVQFTVDLIGKGRFEPLAKAASGGESSRLMLALKCCLQEANPCDTLIFDEIDTGISGAVAFAAGKLLAELSRSVQVICITHLAQVACFAREALLVSKKATEEPVDATCVTMCDSEHISEAIQLLLEGGESSREARNAASELVRQAREATG